MAFWTRQETELHIGFTGAEPSVASVVTNWPYYITRLQRCEGFEPRSEYTPAEGGKELRGDINLREANFLWLRRHIQSDRGLARFQEERAQLPGTPVVSDTAYHPDSGERATLIAGYADDPYWLTIDTDMANWITRLDRNPFAVCVSESRYRDAENIQGRPYGRIYKFPRALLTIRRTRPRGRDLTDEERQELRERMHAMRARRANV
jgi:hypothetical protein